MYLPQKGVTGAVKAGFAVYCLFMPPIGWRWAMAVWGYALAWFIVDDHIKLAAYRIIDPKSGILGSMRAD